MQQPSYIIITHGSSRLGMGHFSRSMNTDTYLRQQGQRGLFFVNESEESRTFFKDSENALFYSDRTCCEKLFPYLPSKPLIIFDCNDVKEEEILFFKEKGCKVAAFDNLQSGREHADSLIDANLDGNDSTQKHLYGERFICLGEHYANLSSQKRIPSRVRSVLVAMGGYDEKQFSLTMFRGLFYAFYYSSYETFEIHLKLPAGGGTIHPTLTEAEYYHELDVQHEGNCYRIVIDDMKELIVHTYDFIEDMPRLILKSDILFTSGGLTVYEGLTAGTYTLAFPQNPAEKKVVERLLRKGYLPAEIDTYRLQEDLEYIFELSEVEFGSFLQKSRSAFDGLGYQRVGNVLLGLMRQ